MWLRALTIAAVLVSCKEPPPPPPTIPLPAPVKPAPPPEPPPAPEPEKVALPAPPVVVSAFPQAVAEEMTDEEQMLRLFLIDPVKAEVALQRIETPDAWLVSIIAQFALNRGSMQAETDLPPPAAQSEVISGPGTAFVSTDGAELTTTDKKPTVIALPVNAKVEVISLEGELANVSVPVAQMAIYGETGSEPAHVVSTPVVGRVKVQQLATKPFELEALVKSAQSQADTEQGRLIAVSTWLLASRVERSERTREGLLRAAWKARRASTLVRAALAKNLAPASGLRFAWACTGEDPSAAPWVELAKSRPKTLPPAVCVSGLDARARCADDTPAELKKAAATKEWIDSMKLAPKPWVRFTVDARDPRQVFVVTTPLEVADPCSEFEEVKFDAASGQVRRLALALGTKTMTIWLPVSRHSGAEFSIPSTASELQAISWLRARGNYRWTVGGKGDLQPSLNVNARSFEVPEDVVAAGYAVAPERDCSCE